jgi:hypothetical protein
MKRLVAFISLIIYGLFNISVSAQELPPGQVVRTLNCALNPGVSMAEVVAWGRNLPRNEHSANQVFFREAIHHNPEFSADYDFQIAWYHGSWEQYISNMEGSRTDPILQRQPTRPQDLMTCSANDAVTIYRAIPDNDGFAGDETLMMTRFCRLEEGKTIADAYGFASSVAANFRAAGNNALMQILTRSIGPVENRTGNAVTLSEVPATAESMAQRLELTRNGLNPTAGLDSPFTICNFPAMWRTYAIWRTPPPQ